MGESTWIYTHTDDVYHSGIRGMKWGVRRYQNSDGSLTDEGRKRYNKYDKYKDLQDPRTGKLTEKGKRVEHDRIERDRKIVKGAFGLMGGAHGLMMGGPLAASVAAIAGGPAAVAGVAFIGGVAGQAALYAKVADLAAKSENDRAHQMVEAGQSWYQRNAKVEMQR